jgi:hypothetical protein
MGTYWVGRTFLPHCAWSLTTDDCGVVETQVDNLNNEESDALINSEDFARNPVGIDFDPEELYEQVQREGEKAVMERLRVRKDVGPRGIESVPAAYMT